MKFSKPLIWAFILMIVATAVSRLMVYNIAGFFPQMAVALFGGAIIKDKKWAFAVPLLSLLVSDSLFQLFYEMNWLGRQGFYDGQWAVYLCFGLVTVFGFLMKKINLKNLMFFSVSGSVLFFITSNFFVWIGVGGLGRPLTFEGLLLCYGDAIAYYRQFGLIEGFVLNSVLGDMIWCTILFGAYYFISKYFLPAKPAIAR